MLFTVTFFPKKSHGVDRNKTRSLDKGTIFQRRVWSLRKEFNGGINTVRQILCEFVQTTDR